MKSSRKKAKRGRKKKNNNNDNDNCKNNCDNDNYESTETDGTFYVIDTPGMDRYGYDHHKILCSIMDRLQDIKNKGIDVAHFYYFFNTKAAIDLDEKYCLRLLNRLAPEIDRIYFIGTRADCYVEGQDKIFEHFKNTLKSTLESIKSTRRRR